MAVKTSPTAAPTPEEGGPPPREEVTVPGAAAPTTPAEKPQATERDPFSLPDDEEDFLPPLDDSPNAETPSEAPASPVDASEDDAGDETEDERIRRILERYKNDPIALAKAVLNKDQKIGEQGNELGQLRKATATPPEDAAEPEDAEEATPNGVAETQEDEEAYLGYDAEGDHSERGWPINSNTGDEYMPVDELGVTFTPESRWEKRLEELTQERGSEARARIALQQEMGQESERRIQERGERIAERGQRQQASFTEELAGHATRLGKTLPEPVARALVNSYGQQVVASIRQQWNSLPPETRYDPRLFAEALNMRIYYAYKNGTLETDAAAMSSQLGEKGVARPAAPRPVPSEGALSTQSPSPAPAAPPEKVRAAMDSGMSQEEAEKYTASTFTYDEL